MKYLKLFWVKVSGPAAVFSAFIFYFLLFPSSSYSQKPKVCGVPRINMTALQKAEKHTLELTGKALIGPTLIRVYFHICRNDDGTTPGATEAQIQSEFNQLVSDFASDNICFANMGLNYINSTQVNNPGFANAALLSPYLVPNCINIFYHNSLGADGGNAYSIPNTFCSIAKGNIGKWRTISHEVGHCFGLIHTHEDCSLSFNNGLFCSITDDHVCDTPADPFCFDGTSCFSNVACSYTGFCTDALFNSNWSPPYDNIMSYWGSVGCNVTIFTNGQYERVNSFLNTDAGLQGCKSAFDAVVGPLNISSGFYEASTINQLSTSSSVTISGTANATFAGGIVLLEDGFYAAPSSGGFILVRGTSCAYSSLTSITKTTSEAIIKSEAINKKPQGILFAYPNPATSQVQLVFTLNDDEKNIFLQVFDMNSHKVKEIRLGYLIAGKQTVPLNLNDLPSGVYYVSLQLNTVRLTTKVVLSK